MQRSINLSQTQLYWATRLVLLNRPFIFNDSQMPLASFENRMVCSFIFDSIFFNSKLLKFHLHRAKFFKNEIHFHLWQIIWPMRREKWFDQTKLEKINNELLNEVKETNGNSFAYQKVSSNCISRNRDSFLYWTIFRANLKHRHMLQNFEIKINFEHVLSLSSLY